MCDDEDAYRQLMMLHGNIDPNESWTLVLTLIHGLSKRCLSAPQPYASRSRSEYGVPMALVLIATYSRRVERVIAC